MTGRVSLFMVVGLSMLMLGLNSSRNTNDAVDNFVAYDGKSTAYAIARSGANIAATALYFSNPIGAPGAFDPAYWSNFRKDADFQGGKLTVSVTKEGSRLRVVSEGTYPASGSGRQSSSFICYLSPGSFDQYVVLTDNDPGTIPWTTYDTARGNLHSNTTLLIDHYTGNPIMPVFNGTVTTGLPVTITTGTVPVFTHGAPRSGITIQFPSSLPVPVDPVFAPGGPGPDWNQKYFINNGEILPSHQQLHLQFFVDNMGNQKVRWFTDVRLTNRGSGWQSPDSSGYYGDFRSTDPVIDPPQSGIVPTRGADVFVEGTIKGRISIVSDTAGSRGGNIFITNDITCNTDPRTDPTSGDVVGLLAANNIVIANTSANVANGGSNIFTIQASLFALKGGVTSADNQSRKRQRLEIYGSIAQGLRKGVGSGNSAIGATTGGFMKGYRYDLRLRSLHAPLIPGAPLMALDSFLIKSGTTQ